MKRRGAWLGVLLVGAVMAEDPPAGSSKAETPEEIAARANTGPGRTWSGMKLGSWREEREVSKNAGRETVVIRRQTLKSRDEEVLRLETTTWRVENGEKVGEPKVTETVLQASGAGVCRDVKELAPETIEVEGRSLECRVVESRIEDETGGRAGERTSSKQTVWYSPEVKVLGGVVKSVSEGEDPSPWVWTSLLEATEIEFTVAGKKLKCARVGANFRGSWKVEIESHLSSEIPGGIVRTLTKRSWTEGNRKVETEILRELIDFHVARSSSD